VNTEYAMARLQSDLGRVPRFTLIFVTIVLFVGSATELV